MKKYLAAAVLTVLVTGCDAGYAAYTLHNAAWDVYDIGTDVLWMARHFV